MHCGAVDARAACQVAVCVVCTVGVQVPYRCPQCRVAQLCTHSHSYTCTWVGGLGHIRVHMCTCAHAHTQERHALAYKSVCMHAHAIWHTHVRAHASVLSRAHRIGRSSWQRSRRGPPSWSRPCATQPPATHARSTRWGQQPRRPAAMLVRLVQTCLWEAQEWGGGKGGLAEPAGRCGSTGRACTSCTPSWHRGCGLCCTAPQGTLLLQQDVQ